METSTRKPAFTCPLCGGQDLLWIRDPLISEQPVSIVEGQFCYGEIAVGRHPEYGGDSRGHDHYQCGNWDCGFEITDDDGFYITDENELLDWLKNPVVVDASECDDAGT